MSIFRNFSIKVKLTLVIVMTSFITLTLASAAYLVNDQKSYKNNLQANLDLLSDIVADNSAAAIAFEDESTALEILQALEKNKHIRWGTITLKDGSKFAQYSRNNISEIYLPVSMPDNGVLWDESLTLKTKVFSDDEYVADLWISSDLNEIESRLNWFLGMSAIVFIVTLLVGTTIAFIFQRVLSKPIKELEKGAMQLALGDFDYEITYCAKDEIGKLTDSFRDIREYLKSLADASKRIAARDLTVHIEPRSEKDVLGLSFQSMLTSLSDMVRQLNESTALVVSAAGEITRSSEEMTTGAEDQSKQVSEVSAAVEEMTTNIVETNTNASNASKASQNASKTAGDGGEIVSKTINGMLNISNVVSSSAKTTQELAQSAEQIGKVIGVIDDIADQTNLLALNAAIEAARAGEQGRGFAVVADEVRKLAERTSHATGEISTMIKGIQTKTSEAVASMEHGIKEVDQGRDLTNEAGNSLEEIVTMSDNVMRMIQQISTASNEQANAAEEVARRINAINEVTENTTIQAKESTEAAKKLNRQAEELQTIVASFKCSTK